MREFRKIVGTPRGGRGNEENRGQRSMANISDPACSDQHFDIDNIAVQFAQSNDPVLFDVEHELDMELQLAEADYLLEESVHASDIEQLFSEISQQQEITAQVAKTEDLVVKGSPQNVCEETALVDKQVLEIKEDKIETEKQVVDSEEPIEIDVQFADINEYINVTEGFVDNGSEVQDRLQNESIPPGEKTVEVQQENKDEKAPLVVIPIDTKYHCKPCNKSFLEELELDDHNLKKHSQILYVCQICLQSFNRNVNLTRHMNSVHQTRSTYICPVCNKDCKQQKELLHHLKNDHNTNKREIFKCKGCNYVTKSCVEFEYHRENECSKTRHACDKCDRTFKRSDHLNRHVKEAHSKEYLKCPKCGKYYGRRDTLIRHLRDTHKVKDAKSIRLNVANT